MATQTTNDTQFPSVPENIGDVKVAPENVLLLRNDPIVAAYNAANPPIPWFADGYLEAEYTFYAIQTTFQTDLGLQASPATASRPAGDADENLIVRVRRPVTFKVVNWTAQRLYVKPVLPHWNTGATNEKLLSRTISARNPLQSLNQKTWEVSGQYAYAFKKEPFVTVNNVEYFVLPASKSAAENLAIPVSLHAYTQADFNFEVLNSSWIPAGAPLDGTLLPIGRNGRVGQPDSVPRETSPGPA